MHRFTDTKKWDEDWYCELKGEYQKLWDYICDHCDNAGVWKPNKIDFEIKTGFKVSLDSFSKKVNGDKLRIAALENGRWFIPGFIQYQWFTKQQSFNLVLTNPRHKHIYEILLANDIDLKNVRGLKEVWKTSKAVAKEDLPLREGLGVTGGKEGADWDTEKQKFLQDGGWIYKFCMEKKLSPEQFTTIANEFLTDLELKEDYKPIKEIRSHFTNWYNKIKNNGKPGANRGSSSGSGSTKPGTSEARIQAAKDY
jgi:hypothetical protein